MTWQDPDPPTSTGETKPTAPQVTDPEFIRQDWQQQLIHGQEQMLYELKVLNDAAVQSNSRLVSVLDDLHDIVTELQVLRSDIATHWPIEAEEPEVNWKAQPQKMLKKVKEKVKAKKAKR